MSRRLLSLLSILAVAVVVASAALADGGPAPGFAFGAGIATRDGRTHYVTLPAGSGTVVAAIDRRGTVLRSNWLHGGFGIPLVASDGTAGGLTRDGSHLVLASYTTTPVTQFAIVTTRTLMVGKTIQLRGMWSFDALSPDGRTIYLIQYLVNATSRRYLVRAYDVTRGRLYKRAITARTERGAMIGSPVARATTANGRWAYTLYVRGNGTGFVHALDTVRHVAVCVDLPWRTMDTWAYDALFWISRDGRTLRVRQRGLGGRTASIDTRTWKVKVSSAL